MSAFARIVYAYGLVCAASNVVSPLWPSFQQAYGMSTLTMTVVFVAYVVGAVAALIVFGGSSDVWGRRPALIAASACVLAGALCFATAQNVWWLVAGRFVTGLAVGIASASANAALADVAGRRGVRGASSVGSLTAALGFAGGPLAAGIIADLAPAPLRTCFWVLAAFALAATLAMTTIPNTGRAGGSVRLQGIGVPAAVAVPFARACAVFVTGWVGAGIFLVLGPSMMRDFLGTPSAALAGVGLAIFFGCGAVGQVTLRRRPMSEVGAIALALLVVGLAAMAAGIAAHSLPLFFLAVAAAGAANGLSFLAGLTLVNAVAPAERRAQTLTAFFLTGYGAVALGFPLVGWFADRYGLRAALDGYALAFSAAAVVTLVDLLRWGRAPDRARG